MDILNEAGVLVFQEVPVGGWVWFLLLLPAVFIAGAIHTLLRNDERSRSQRSYALGVLLLALVFVPIPWVAQQSHTGLRFEFDESARLVRVRDALSPDVYATPFASFRGLVLADDAPPGTVVGASDERSDIRYELTAVRRSGPAYTLLATSDRVRVLEQASRLAHMLQLTTVSDWTALLAFASESPETTARLPLPAECAAGSGALRAREAAPDRCALEYDRQVPALVWPALLLVLAGVYWLRYALRLWGAKFYLLGAGVLLLLVTLGLGRAILLGVGTQGVIEFIQDGDGHTMLRSWTESPVWPDRLALDKMPLHEIRAVDARIGPDANKFVIYNRNPFAGKNPLQALQTLSSLRYMELDLAGVPAVDRLRLADLLASGMGW